MGKRRTIRKRKIIPNQVFVGCPWKTVRRKYETAIESLKKKYPLSFVIVGRDPSQQEATDLLELIKKELLSSSAAIFDATGGNANVSLEFGFAEGQQIPGSLYSSGHKSSKKQSDQSPIISNLAGKRRNMYKTQKTLEGLLDSFAITHEYTRQFERSIQTQFRNFTKGEKKSGRALALKIIHCLDGFERIKRTDLIQKLSSPHENYNGIEIDQMIRLLHKAKLLISKRGRYSSIQMVP